VALMVAAAVAAAMVVVEAKSERGDWGSMYAGKGYTYTNWRQFGAK